ncbi:MAG: VUT family protein [Alphaproteobacteria bacterium]|nr:VUT family protein [Alphaproteobacteria bacterium]
MSNEMLCIAFLLLSLSAAVGAARLGQAWLQGYIITVLLLLGITDAKVIDAFGVPVTLGTILYSAIFFSSDLMTEHYGKTAAYRTVRISFAAILVFQLFVQLTTLAAPATGVEELSAAMDVVFGASLRIVIVGLFVYLVSQHLDIWLYNRIHRLTGERWLWLRNNGSTAVSQAVDTYLFCFLAFYGVIDNWYWLATVGYGVKMVVAFSDTAFIYLGKILVPPYRPNENGIR